MIQKLHARPLPDFLDDGPQLLVGLLQITCTTGGGAQVTPRSPTPATAPRADRQRRDEATFRLDLESRAHQGEQGGVEHDGAVAVEGHVHGYQPLEGEHHHRPLARRNPAAAAQLRGASGQEACSLSLPAAHIGHRSPQTDHSRTKNCIFYI